jgi:hypothetical protein
MSLPTSDLLPRCCRSHQTWNALAHCLLLSYTPALEDAAVVEHVNRARQAVEVLIPLDGPTRLEIGELIARNQLEIASGRREDCARMDPQPHVRARRAVVSA